MKKNKISKLVEREKRFMVFGAVLLLFLWGISFFMKNSLASINIEVERLSRDIKEQKEVNQSLTMKINELASLENIQSVANYEGLAYNSSNILIVNKK